LGCELLEIPVAKQLEQVDERQTSTRGPAEDLESGIVKKKLAHVRVSVSQALFAARWAKDTS